MIKLDKLKAIMKEDILIVKYLNYERFWDNHNKYKNKNILYYFFLHYIYVYTNINHRFFLLLKQL